MMSERPLEGCHIAAKYGVHPNTFNNWVKRHQHHIGLRIGNRWSRLQIEIMRNIFGEWEYPNAIFQRPKRKEKVKTKRKKK